MSEAPDTPVLAVEDLRFAWPREAGLQAFALSVEGFSLRGGEAVLLRGPSGAGKSTLLGLLAGVLLPTSGSVRVEGRGWAGLSEPARRAWRLARVGQLLQDAPLVPYLTARDNVALPQRLRGGDESLADELVDAVGLRDRAGHRPGALSTGERRRVALARALVTRAPLVLADEPLAGLDAERGEEVLALLRQHTVDRGGALVVVSHQVGLSGSFDRVLQAKGGHVAEAGHGVSGEPC